MTKTERFCDEMERLHRKAAPGPWEEARTRREAGNR